MLGTATRLQNARTISLSGAVSGSTSFNGSRNVTITTTQANIAVLTGTLPHDGTSTDITINYPSGYTRDNCVVIAKEGKRGTSSDIYTTGTTFDTINYIKGGLALSVSLQDTYITIRAKNINLTDGDTAMVKPIAADTTFGYRIVLLKIS